MKRTSWLIVLLMVMTIGCGGEKKENPLIPRTFDISELTGIKGPFYFKDHHAGKELFGDYDPEKVIKEYSFTPIRREGGCICLCNS